MKKSKLALVLALMFCLVCSNYASDGKVKDMKASGKLSLIKEKFYKVINGDKKYGFSKGAKKQLDLSKFVGKEVNFYGRGKEEKGTFMVLKVLRLQEKGEGTEKKPIESIASGKLKKFGDIYKVYLHKEKIWFILPDDKKLKDLEGKVVILHGTAYKDGENFQVKKLHKIEEASKS